MKKEEAIEFFRDMNECTYGNLEAVEMAIKALEQEPCEDAISREAVLELIADYDLSMGQVVKVIHALPSVTPSRPKGHWIKTPLLTCDRCNKINKSGIESNFCPNCGCKMVGDINANSN